MSEFDQPCTFDPKTKIAVGDDKTLADCKTKFLHPGPFPGDPFLPPVPSLEQQQRTAVIEEAQTWLKTPFVHHQQTKGAGVDCVGLLLGVFSNVGLIPLTDPGPYAMDWHLHRDEEKYLEGILKFAHEIPGPPKPGDVALYKFGRTYSHGVIVVCWPLAIQAYIGRNVEWVDVESDQTFQKPKVKFFSIWGE